MEKIIEYDNNGYKFAVIENGKIHKEGHPAFDVAPSHISEYNGWNTHPYALSVDCGYDGCIHPKVKKHE